MILHPKKDIVDDNQDDKNEDKKDDGNDNNNDRDNESMKNCFIKIIMEFIRRLLKLKK